MKLRPLDDYDVSAERGFLCKYDASAVAVPGCLEAVRELASALPDRIAAGRVRRDVQALPDIGSAEIDAIDDEAALRTAVVYYTFLGQAYVWCEPDVATALPRALAGPLWRLCERLGQPPILTYSSYVLDNWSLIDADSPVGLDNVRMLTHFDGGQDESWFVMDHVAIEAAAGRMLARIPAAVDCAVSEDAAGLCDELESMLYVWGQMQSAFNRMPERCDPHVYFQRVRPWIHGFKDNPATPDGIVYEGVEATGGQPQAFRGQTGSQSSIVPVMDALLSVGHSRDPLRAYLDELHIYRPPKHREFIEHVRTTSRVRRAVQKLEDASLTEAYNDCLESLTRFRTRHLEYAASYIARQSRGSAGNATDVGTGGTPFMKYLKKHRDEASAARL